MKKIDVGDLAQTIATLGVVGGLILLAFELHQNNKFLEAEANLVLSQNRIAAMEMLATDDGIGSAVVAGMSGDDLTGLQELKLKAFYSSIFTKWQWEYEQFNGGLIASDRLPVSDWRSFFYSFPRMPAIWKMDINLYTPEFVQFMEENVVGE